MQVPILQDVSDLGIDETDCTNLPIHPGCLPVFPVVIIHSEDFDFVSGFHDSEISRV